MPDPDFSVSDVKLFVGKFLLTAHDFTICTQTLRVKYTEQIKFVGKGLITVKY